jgi:competence transcription factor ComK
VLMLTLHSRRWRHSYFANFYVYSISAKTATLLDEQNRRLMNPTWSDASNNIVWLSPCAV